ncbi:hypothetical protein FISHEDRAFT_44903 [Fistulina hepatica ATCC 64428]|uniref:choline-phosphate cytidylyltransferase n=1 Tax=Fistulina hepatica ATCC 64428 TaxID=1128425 RepID=A0A0D7AA07_9AGAR|nr:hypothetical protein FISHEDRAFT_44903 [Fistulina hepatica ATCC 64428]
MESADPPVASHRKVLHTKRSFGKYPKGLESPAYDASEEDNDPLTDDSSRVSVPVRSNRLPQFRLVTATRARHQLAASLLSDSDGVDSPTYDGDVESSATAGPAGHMVAPSGSHHERSSSTSTLNTPSPPVRQFPATTGQSLEDFTRRPQSGITTVLNEPSASSPVQEAFDPASLTPEDIQVYVSRVIAGESWRKYKINKPPVGRPVRIYADGVYDLFHFGHALQLRQAKLSFPSVYLLVGVNSDELVKQYKARTIMTHAERLEAVRHCRWVDEEVADAPWVIDQQFIDAYQIDYVAHDEDPYAAAGLADVYAYAKSIGKFIPTRRTPGVSTSSLLERIVSGYRNCDFDDKLTKMGHAELRAEGSDFDSSRNVSRSMSPVGFSPMK